MKTILITIMSLTLLTASTWQNIQSPTESNTHLVAYPGDLDRTVMEFSIEGFHLLPVNKTEGEMYLARLSDGASLLEEGFPDMHKYARSIVIPDDKEMILRVLSSEFVDYENIIIAPSKGNISRNINPADVEYKFGSVYQKDIYMMHPINPYLFL